MVLHVALLAGLVAAKVETRLPPRPDFASMIPQTSTTFVGRMWDNCDPARQEAVALAKFLNRIWDAVTANEKVSSQYALDLLTAFQQFDVALITLNPNPTVGEAMTRVYVYQPVIAVVRREIERDEANPKPLPPGQLHQLPAQLHRMNLAISRQYGPVFARAVLPLRFG